jgi:isocitrate dehydrogenase
MKAAQGHPVDIGGYYVANPPKFDAVMRPSATFNAALDAATKRVGDPVPA